MKKLSVLIALALCLTITGAYATWTYYTTVPASVNGTIGVSISTSEEIDAGTLAKSEGTLTLTIDDVNNNYLPGFSANGSITITFTAHERAPEDVRTYGIDVPLTIATANIGNYESTAAISVKSTANDLVIGRTDGSSPFKWTSQGNGVFTCEITAAKIAEYLTILDGSTKLDTLTKYNNFKTALGANPQITLVIGDSSR